MAIQVQGGVSGTALGVASETQNAAHATIKPVPYGALGHYTCSVRILSTAAQAANSRIFEIRNTGANLIIPTKLTLRALQVAVGTAQENSIDAYKVTGFTAVDTVNTVTPVSSTKKTTGMTAYPGNTQIRHLTLAGAAAGMTGGTLVKDTQFFGTLPYNIATTVNTTSIWGPIDVCAPELGTHPFALAQNEGIIVENRASNITSYGIAWFVDFAWVEASAF